MRLHSAMLFVKDLSKMTRFYTDQLGLKPVEATRMENWVEFEEGFALHAIPPELACHIEIASPPQPREKNPVKLFFEVPDAERERARLESAGVPIIARPWGAWEAVDPEGNIFALRSALQ